MEDCLFCNIIKGNIPSTKVYEDEHVYAFRDINPIAPVHVIVVPKQHLSCANDVNATNSDAIAHIFEAIPKIAKQEGIADGYNILNNCGEKGGQSVMHLHFHLLGGLDINSLLQHKA